MKHKVLCVVGTRPEAIKMAPVILALKKESWCECRVLATAQHRQILDQVLRIFSIEPDIDLDIMEPNQSLASLTAKLLLRLNEVIIRERPAAVLAQGDTTTVMTIALVCFYNHIPFAHVEAGLRTGDIRNPFPEELNRVIAGRLSQWHFAPTPSTREHLLREGVPDAAIHVTGNTVIDALKSVAELKPQVGVELDPDKRLILVTAHRRENFGEPFRQICKALVKLADKNHDVQILYPVHPNPNIHEVAHEMLAGHPRILLCQPLDYLPFVGAMQRAYIILSDSGGVQEEAPFLSKPVLVLRRETERPEAVDAGVVKLVGPDYERIIEEAQKLLDDEHAYRLMARNISPYGDGEAASRIAAILGKHFN